MNRYGRNRNDYELHKNLIDWDEKFRTYPYRVVGSHSEGGWRAHTIADITTDLFAILISKEKILWVRHRKEIEKLLDHEAITFADPDNNHLPIGILRTYSEQEMVEFVLHRPSVHLRIFEKVRDIIPLNFHTAMMKYVLTAIAHPSTFHLVQDFAVQAIDVSFFKAVPQLDAWTIINVFQACKYEAATIHSTSHVYLNIWKALYCGFPKIPLEKFHYPTNLSAEMYDERITIDLYQDYSETESQRHLRTQEQFIIAFLFCDRRHLRSDSEKNIIAALSFIQELDVKYYVNFFESQYHRNEMIDTLFIVLRQDHIDISFHLEQILLNLSRYAGKSSEGWLSIPKNEILAMFSGKGLLIFLKDMCSELSDRNALFYLNLRIRMNAESGGQLFPLTGRIEDDFLNEFKKYDDGSEFLALWNLLKFKFPIEMNWGIDENNKNEEIRSILGYGTEKYEIHPNQNISIDHCTALLRFFNMESTDYRSLYADRHRNEAFGGIRWSFRNLTHLFDMIAATVMNLMAFNLEEFEKPEIGRIYEWAGKSTLEFENYRNFSLSCLLEILCISDVFGSNRGEFSYMTRDLCRGRDGLTILSREERNYFQYTIDRDFEEIIQNYKYDRRHKDILQYIVPLVDTFCLSMEATSDFFYHAYDELFDYFYVPSVKALLHIHPKQALRLIVAFCRSHLMLSLSASYSDLHRYKLDWDRRFKEMNVKKSLQYFNSFHTTVEDLFRGERVYSDRLTHLLMETFVAAIVNRDRIYQAAEVRDYLVCVHYYKLIADRGYNWDDWKIIRIEEAKEILIGEENEVEKLPVVEIKVGKTPVVEIEVQKLFVVEIEVQKLFVVENEIEKLSVVDTEVEKSPAVETEVEEQTVVDTEVEKSPAVKTEVEEQTVVDTEVEKSPAVETEVEEQTVVETEVEKSPLGKTEAAEPPVVDTENGKSPVVEIEVEKLAFVETEVAEHAVAKTEVAEPAFVETTVQN